MDEVCGTAEIAARLGVHRTVAHKMVVQGAISGVRVGRAWVVPKVELERFAANYQSKRGWPKGKKRSPLTDVSSPSQVLQIPQRERSTSSQEMQSAQELKYWERQNTIGLSDRELARRAGLSPILVSYLKRGKRRLTPKVEESLARALEMNIRVGTDPPRYLSRRILIGLLFALATGVFFFRWIALDPFESDPRLRHSVSMAGMMFCLAGLGVLVHYISHKGQRKLDGPLLWGGGYRGVFKRSSETGWMRTAERRLEICGTCHGIFSIARHPDNELWYWAEPHANCVLFHVDMQLWSTGVRSAFHAEEK